VTTSPIIDLFEQERSRLFALAYAVLGSRAEAADTVQDAWLRWDCARRESADLREPGAWLTTVITRLALDRLRSARARRESYPGVWLPEPIVDAPSAEDQALQRANLTLAFLFLLERLGSDERAAFVLREVFDESYREIAAALEKSEAACRQLVTRARERVREDRVRKPVDRVEFDRVLNRYLAALAAGDAHELVELIAPGAVLYGDGGGKRLAVVNPLQGPDRIIRFMLGLRRKYPGQFSVVPASVNGFPGFRIMVGDEMIGIAYYEVADGRIQNIYNVLNPDKLAREPVIVRSIR